MENGAAEDCCKQRYYNNTRSFKNETYNNDINHSSYLLVRKNSAKEKPKTIGSVLKFVSGIKLLN